MRPITRRELLTSFGYCLIGMAVPTLSHARETMIEITASPNCGCCKQWAEYLEEQQFATKLTYTDDIILFKNSLALPTDLRSCHTAQVSGYIIEGHVPANSIRRLLVEKPRISGLAVPGMPIGSPGMEVPGMGSESYDVIAFSADEQYVFESYFGDQKA